MMPSEKKIKTFLQKLFFKNKKPNDSWLFLAIKDTRGKKNMHLCLRHFNNSSFLSLSSLSLVFSSMVCV